MKKLSCIVVSLLALAALLGVASAAGLVVALRKDGAGAGTAIRRRRSRQRLLTWQALPQVEVDTPWWLLPLGAVFFGWVAWALRWTVQ